jgi:hypothetical protein
MHSTPLPSLHRIQLLVRCAWKLYCQSPHRTSAILDIASSEGLSSARCSDVLKSGFFLQYQVKTPHTHTSPLNTCNHILQPSLISTYLAILSDTSPNRNDGSLGASRPPSEALPLHSSHLLLPRASRGSSRHAQIRACQKRISQSGSRSRMDRRPGRWPFSHFI